MNNPKYKKAFTLAEILIALAIMSLISVLCIRSITDTREKQEAVVRLQKTYEDINKAVANGIIENGSIDYWDFTMEPDEFIDTYLKTLMFGSNIQYNGATSHDDRIDIFIDTNGNKVPDRLGIDRFVISIAIDGTVLLPTWDEDENIDKTIKTRNELLESCKEDGYSCGALIQRDGWKIERDYPWK